MKNVIWHGLLTLCTVLIVLPWARAVEVPENLVDLEYMYDSIDPDGDVMLRTDLLGNIVNMDTALNAVRQQIQIMSAEDKASSANIDLTTLFAETAISNAARKQVSGNEIIVNRDAVSKLDDTAKDTREAMEQLLEDGGIQVARDMADTVTFLSNASGQVRIRVEPSILQTSVDRVRIELPSFAITLKLDDLREDLRETVTIVVEDLGTGYETGTSNRIPSVRIDLPDGRLSNPITLSLPTGSAEPTYMAVMDIDGSAASSKYNPATTSLDGKVNESGQYTPMGNAKDFSDIADKDALMQKAIRELSARGIINGTSDTTFTPDGPLKRSHFVALIMRGLGKIDNTATSDFKDVSPSDFYYAAVASSKQRNIIEGYADGCFHGDWLLNKRQIYTVTGRILVSEMGYRKPVNMDAYLSKFGDIVANNENMKAMIALSLREDLIVLRRDGMFDGDSTMTRGNAAVILYSLFQKIW